MAGKLFAKSSLPSNQLTAGNEYEAEMFDLFGDTDQILIEGEIDGDVTGEDVVQATSMWTDYSSVFPTLHEQGRNLARDIEWSFITEGGSG